MAAGTADGMLDRRMVHSLNGSLSVRPVGCSVVLVIVVTLVTGLGVGLNGWG